MKQDEAYWLGELLAVIHCDGGHYQAEHGTAKATNDAIEKRNQLVRKVDELQTALAAMHKQYEELAVAAVAKIKHETR